MSLDDDQTIIRTVAPKKILKRKMFHSLIEEFAVFENCLNQKLENFFVKNVSSFHFLVDANLFPWHKFFTMYKLTGVLVHSNFLS